MRLLIATSHRALVGGAESYLRALLPALRQRGFELGVVYETDASPGAPTVDEGLEGLPSWIAASLGEARTLEAVAAFGPQLVYQQGMSSPSLEAGLLEVAPAVFFVHAYHGACISGTRRFAWPRERPCSRAFGPGCLVHYLPHRCGGLSPITMIREYGVQRRREGLLGRYRALAFASTHMLELYHRAGVSAAPHHLAPLFPTGVAPDPEPPQPRAGSGTILFVGRLTGLKGLQLLIPAIGRAERQLGHPLRLEVLGEGPEQGRFVALARAQGLTVEFAGKVSAEERNRRMRRADLLAIPSVWPEPFGLSGVEAACVGLPAVGFEVGGIPEWLEAGVGGELAPGELPTSEGLGEAIVRALGDPAHHQRLREGAWHASQRFRLDAHLQALTGIFAAATKGA